MKNQFDNAISVLFMLLIMIVSVYFMIINPKVSYANNTTEDVTVRKVTVDKFPKVVNATSKDVLVENVMTVSYIAYTHEYMITYYSTTPIGERIIYEEIFDANEVQIITESGPCKVEVIRFHCPTCPDSPY